jgi:hypothetical protein
MRLASFRELPRRCVNLSNSEVLIYGRGGFICRVLHCRLRISGRLLRVAFQLLSGTFRLEVPESVRDFPIQCATCFVVAAKGERCRRALAAGGSCRLGRHEMSRKVLVRG